MTANDTMATNGTTPANGTDPVTATPAAPDNSTARNVIIPPPKIPDISPSPPNSDVSGGAVAAMAMAALAALF